MSLCLKFEEDQISGCWDIQTFVLLGHLPLGPQMKVVFIETFFEFGLVQWAYVYNLRMIQSVAAEIFKFLYFEVIFQKR